MAVLGPVIPVLRIFDEQKAREFYIDFLGFKLGFEHRYEPGFPLYMGVSHGDCALHLSEHFGDGSPGVQVRISADDVDAYSAELLAKQYKHAKPGKAEVMPWGKKELTIADPFGNRLTFFEDANE
jgi:catechol 2,3-dioxygenase-like lactoylglutathione lyase family enzyme